MRLANLKHAKADEGRDLLPLENGFFHQLTFQQYWFLILTHQPAFVFRVKG